MTETKYIFKVTLAGRGANVREAWQNARENFYEDPVSYDECVKELGTGWNTENKWTLKQIRERIRTLASLHQKYKAFRIIEFEQDKNEVLSILDIREIGDLPTINEKYQYGSWYDDIAKNVAGALIQIEGVLREDGWWHD